MSSAAAKSGYSDDGGLANELRQRHDQITERIHELHEHAAEIAARQSPDRAGQEHLRGRDLSP